MDRRIIAVMFKAEFFIFCRGVSQDAQGESLLETFDTIYFTQLPARQYPFQGIARLRASEPVINRTLVARIAVKLGPKTVAEQTLNLEHVMVEKDAAISIRFDFRELAFTETGKYVFNLSLDNKLMIASPLLVKSAEDLVEK